MKREYKTKAGKAIDQYISQQRERSFCASDVYTYLEEQKIAVNLATVYRNLDRLTERKVLTRFKTANRESYMYRAVKEECDCHRHLHMQCRKCGGIFHLEGEFMKQISDCLEEQYGFFLECDNSVFIGICRNCR